MKKRLIHPTGPKEIKANTLKPVLEDGTPKLKKVIGFPGYNGWKYHPTRGFKKIAGFVAKPKDE